ncbi:MAG: chorismate-binding protein [Cytophagaceae bacterium]|nr:chorismate-binding protein [Cytophagaceae bacterium]
MHWNRTVLETILQHADRHYSHFALTFSNGQIPYPEGSFDGWLALGSERYFSGKGDHDFEHLGKFASDSKRKIFGYLSYELTAQLEPGIKPLATLPYRVPTMHFFEPSFLIPQSDWEWFAGTLPAPTSRPDERPLKIRQHSNPSEYYKAVSKLKKHIALGDIYETNYCISFSGKGLIDPVAVFCDLMEVSPMPFSALYKCQDFYILSASPERYLKKTGNTLISQPIKGTVAANKDERVLFSEKERSENVMIVDLVRNDLSKICTGGSVQVEELCGIYKLPGLFQMISTIKGTLDSGKDWTEAIKATFPMGSMTGAPKSRAVLYTELLESQHRALFSGALGYIDPTNDFD